MKIVVVTGGREYLTPRPVEAEVIEVALRPMAPGAVVPRTRWAPSGGSPYHAFLYDDVTDRDRRVALFLEYLADVVPAGGCAVAVLPFEASADAAGRAAITDERIRHFVGLAQAQAGASVRCARLHLSDNTEAVLHRLGNRAERDSLPAPGPTATPLAFVATAPLDAAHRNYSEAILRLAEPIVARDSVFAGAGRAAHVARLLEHNELTIRADLGPDRVLEQLRPGGELFDLLSRPLPPIVEPNQDGAIVSIPKVAGALS